MRIETDDYTQLKDVASIIGVSEPTARRLAKRLGVVVTVFGRDIVHRRDIEKMQAAKRGCIGNPDWIGSSDAAAAAAKRAVKSRMKRIAEDGLTKAERLRNKNLAKIGAALGGRKPSDA